MHSVRETAAFAAWVALIGITAIWGNSLMDSDPRMGLGAAPLYGRFDVMLARTILLPAAVGAMVLLLYPKVVLPRRSFLLLACVVAGAWAIALAFASDAGLSGSLENHPDYLRVVGLMPSPGPFLESFADSLANYPIHVQAHPPGFPLVLWSMAQLGMPGIGWGAGLVVLACASIPAAVLLVVWEISGEGTARRAAPFVVLSPTAIWMVTSGDALFAALGAWATALVVLSAGKPERSGVVWALAGGIVAGLGLYMSYGLAPLMILPVVLGVHLKAYRSLAWAAAGATLVAAAFGAFGFWWFDGLAATRVRYELSISRFRPYSYFVVANLAALAAAVGPAVAAGLARLRERATWLIVGAALAAVIVADLSGLSKGEVERIWLPFAVWLTVACGALAAQRWRPYLALQALWAIVMQGVVLEPW